MKKVIIVAIAGMLLMPFFTAVAYFTGPYTPVNNASQVMVAAAIQKQTNETDSGEIQKFYDTDERVICYVYVGKAISCVNDMTN